MKIKAEVPLAEIIENFNDELKSLTSGYGSFHFKELDFRHSDIEYLKITIMDEAVSSF